MESFLTEQNGDVFLTYHDYSNINIFEINNDSIHYVCTIDASSNCFKKIESITQYDYIDVTTDTFRAIVKSGITTFEKINKKNINMSINIGNKKYTIEKYKQTIIPCIRLLGNGEIIPITEGKKALENKMNTFLNINVEGNTPFLKSQMDLFESFKHIISEHKNKIIENFLFEKLISTSLDSLFSDLFYSRGTVEIFSENATCDQTKFIDVAEYDGNIIIFGYIDKNQNDADLEYTFPKIKSSDDDLFVVRYNGMNFFTKQKIDENISFDVLFTPTNMEKVTTNPIHGNLQTQIIGLTPENDEYIFTNSSGNQMILQKKINNTFVNFLNHTVNIKYNMIFDFKETEFKIEPNQLLTHRILKDGKNISREVLLSNDKKYTDYDIIEYMYS